MMLDSELRIVPPDMACMGVISQHKDEGVVNDIFSDYRIKERLKYWSAESLRLELKLSEVSGGLVSGLAWENRHLNNLNNNYVKEFIENTSGFLGCFIAPKGTVSEIIEICNELDRSIFPIIELIPKWSNFVFSEKEYDDLMQGLSGLGFIIKLYTAHPTQKFSGNNVFQSYSLIKRNPSVKFIIPHLGGLMPLYALNEGSENIFDNVLFLTSVSSSLKMVPICMSVLPNRISFASDYPFNHDCSIKNSISKCRILVDESEQDNLFFGNLNEFMGGPWSC